MPSAVLFFPDHIMELTNFVTRSDPYTGSASTPRFAMCPFRGISYQLSAFIQNRQLTAVVSHRTSIGLAYGSQPPPRPGCRESRDTALLAGPSRGRRG